MGKNEQKCQLPEQGFVFWPVGTGDSTTIAVNDEVRMQIDLHHMTCAEDDDDPHTPIVDRLVDLLPQRNDKPYLAVFVLTHPDEDHCLGFTDLLKRVIIGELWFTPRVFREYKADLCQDAKTFQKEAKRRVKKVIDAQGKVVSGDRVHLIGYDELLQEEDFNGFPRDQFTVPGNSITELDGEECKEAFRAFVHAPFKDDSDGERNDTSVALQVTLYRAAAEASALLLGDHCYPTIKRIFDRSKAADLAWNVMLAAHHCSKSVMYWQDEGEEEEKLKQGILDDMDKAEQSPGYIVASSEPIPTSNKDGDCPPHAKAKARYEEIVADAFICTQEHPDAKKPRPIVFELLDAGLSLRDKDAVKRADAVKAIAAAVTAARGNQEPPTERVGFGPAR